MFWIIRYAASVSHERHVFSAPRGAEITRLRSMRVVIGDVLCKSLGSPNYINVARATMAGLSGLRRPDEMARLRGLDPEEFMPPALWRAWQESERGPAPEPTEVR